MNDKPLYVAKRTLFDPTIVAGAIIFLTGFALAICGGKYAKYGIMILLLGILIIVMMVVALSMYKAEVYNDKIVITAGVFSRRSEDISLSNVASVKISKSLLGRLFNYGDVTFDIIGKSPVLLPSISNADKLDTILKEYMNK